MRNALGLMLASVVAAVLIAAGGWFYYSTRADQGAPKTVAARAADPLPAPAKLAAKDDVETTATVAAKPTAFAQAPAPAPAPIMTAFQFVAVIGAGAWGTALATVAARAGRNVTLWARTAEHAARIASTRDNPRLPGVQLAPEIAVTHELADAARADMPAIAGFA